ncbi:MAG: glycosyltransferase [Candidatus Omnitrophota bacterium]|nr:glycosyltransferase [Candidatus Omnitrophota bacterium]
MNILLINYEYPPLGGGGGIFTRCLAEEFAVNHNVDVLTSHFRGLKKRETVKRVNLHRVPVLRRTSLHTATMSSMLSFPFSAIAEGIRLTRRKKYDIINTYFAIPSGPAGSFLSRISGIPNVLNILGGDIYDPSKKTSPHRHAILRRTVRNVMINASKVVTESTNIANYAKTFYRPAKDITVIPLGLPEPHFTQITREELFLRQDKLYLISIGRFIKRKGFDFLIKATGLLRKQGNDIDLMLIGEGPERAALEKLSNKLGVSDHITFLDSVSDEKKFQYLAAADIYVLPSLHEGFGIVLLEAMYCGLPIVATNEGGQTDIVEDGENGLLVPPHDPAALADAIALLMKDPDQRQDMSSCNREYVKQYNISAVAARYLELFRGVIASD